MGTIPYRLDEARLILSRTPGAVRSLVQGLPEPWIRNDYGTGTWGPAEVIAHLIFAEQTDWMPRVRMTLEHGEGRAFEPFDRAGHKPMLGRSVGELLDGFERARAESLAALNGLHLAEADLDRRGTHPGLGACTLRNLLATWVVHDFNHIAQIAKGMAFQYGDQVGLWSQYLSILAPPSPR
ncbi:MAG: DinB family protein [Phycisphaerales bacterium]